MSLELTPARRAGTPRSFPKIMVAISIWPSLAIETASPGLSAEGGEGRAAANWSLSESVQLVRHALKLRHTVMQARTRTACFCNCALKIPLASFSKSGRHDDAERWQGAQKRRTSNVSPSTITSAALHRGAAASTCSPLLITNTMAPAGPPKFRIFA